MYVTIPYACNPETIYFLTQDETGTSLVPMYLMQSLKIHISLLFPHIHHMYVTVLKFGTLHLLLKADVMGVVLHGHV